ncbi:MAG: PD-(D/E)XK nuclease domain-containing protein, partial [Lachnospiraceae bacterium]|nr:PD-(D/E)XK nuclease domain-containing protein [Lachnospiraceae bacterium]
NRESGFGRYDVIMEPKKKELPAIIMEFKVFNKRREKSLEETAEAALKQIEEKQYEETLISRGIEAERIRKYGFAFLGKEVLIEERR